MKNPEEAKKAILMATIDEIAENGLSNVRTQKIAKRAGVATGLLHYHFKTKENLFMEIAKLFSGSNLIDDIFITPYAGKCGPAEKMQIILYAMLEIIFKSKTENLIRFYHMIFAEGEKFINRFLKNYDFFAENYITHVIKDGISKGIFQMSYPEYYSSIMYNTLINNFSKYGVFKGTRHQEGFFPEPYPETFKIHIMETSMKSLMVPERYHEIGPIAADLKEIVDFYINLVSEKLMIISPHLMLKIISRLLNDGIENKIGEIHNEIEESDDEPADAHDNFSDSERTEQR